jgi:hypothetical protein
LFTDSTARKLKGVIDLDCLEQVDSGLTFESGKVKYQVSKLGNYRYRYGIRSLSTSNGILLT